MWIVDDINSLLSEKQVLEGGGYLIWFDQILGPHNFQNNKDAKC